MTYGALSYFLNRKIFFFAAGQREKRGRFEDRTSERNETP
jgi:hypothetical protein